MGYHQALKSNKTISKPVQRHCVKSVCIRSYACPHFLNSDLIREDMLRISPYSVRMRENAGQNNSENAHFLRSASS